VGAGPAGLLLALLLGKHGGIEVTVLEAWDRVDERLRATQYGTPASRIFREAGVLDDIRASMITNFKSIVWRSVKDDGKVLTGIDLNLTKDNPDKITVLPLNQILKIVYEHCLRQETVSIRFEHRVVGVGQNETGSWVDVEIGPDGSEKSQQRFEADYVIGCDGGTSKVRHELFGRNWPGITWPHTLLVQNVCGRLAIHSP
jgi:2-polyprenyl-6-methoxyphenol hydroxylase-like FAD-dependent oxidoreductase